MRCAGSVSDVTNHDLGDGHSIEAGTIYEIFECPNCRKPTMGSGSWHEAMIDEEEDWSPSFYVPDRGFARARQLASASEAHQDFMRKAVAQARKCVSEVGRVSPKVGAVIVRDGKLVASGYRGEIKPGQHAEYTVLELKCADERLAGSTVYTTLEPCTARNPPKHPCSEHLTGRRVSRVVIGMLDPDDQIRGRGILTLRNAGIQVDLFPPDLMTELEELNREFIRSKATGR